MRKLHSRFNFSSVYGVFFILAAMLVLQGCAGGSPWEVKSSRPAGQSPSDLSSPSSVIESMKVPPAAVESAPLEAPTKTSDTTDLPPVKVAILLPLSGQNAQLGQAMLNAAQMAIFDVGFPNFELMPKDTKDTPAAARAAAQSAINEGAQLVLGPIFADSVKAVKEVTQAAQVKMIAFSTDWTLASEDTYLIGFLPFDQVERVVTYAGQKGYKRIGVISPNDTYGNGVVSAYQSIARHTGMTPARIDRFSPQGQDISPLMRGFTSYDQRKAAPNQALPFDAVLMPVGGPLAHQVSTLMNSYGMPPQSVKRLGTGLLDDNTLATDKTMQGAWFAAPAPSSRQKFERRYIATYGAGAPPRISSLAYDATALAAILARSGFQTQGAPAFDNTSITNPNGFAGVDGIFRFRPDGIVERGLAVLEYRNGGIAVIDEAPKTFQKTAY